MNIIISIIFMDINEVVDLIYSRPPMIPFAMKLIFDKDDRELFIIFNILVKILISGLYILYNNGERWNNSVNNIMDLSTISRSNFETLNEYMHGIGYDVKIIIEQSEIQNQKLSIYKVHGGNRLKDYHALIIQEYIEYDITIDIYAPNTKCNGMLII